MPRNSNLPTPHFKNPPVVETVLGVQFARLGDMRVTHYGLLLAHLKAAFADGEERFTNVSEQQPLDPVIEEFGSGRVRSRAAGWSVSSAPPSPRCWYASRNEETLVQVQPDRFLFNWRQQPDAKGEYPRYEHNRDKFFTAFDAFTRFVETESVGAIQPNQCEVTYVNHVDVSEGKHAAEMMNRLLTGWQLATSDGWLKRAETGHYAISYVMPGEQGRLHVEAQPAIRRDDEREIIRLTLTARGAPPSQDRKGVLSWLNLGHEWVVRGFASVTTPEMHGQWGRIT